MRHHASLIEGDVSRLHALVEGVARERGLHIQGNPDFHVRTFESFGVDDVRELKSLAELRASGERVFVIAASKMTTEAQNALLKLFEEPPQGASFYLLVPHGTILPTLRSRMVSRSAPEGVDDNAEATEFLAGTYGERTKRIAAYLKDKDKEGVRQLLDSLERVLYAKKDREVHLSSLADIAHVRKYLADRSPSLKMLLEHLAASLPRG